MLEHQEAKLQENLYKENRELIELMVETTFFKPEEKEELLFQFFGTVKGVLTPEEEHDFELYAQYVLKRVVNATLHKYGVDKENSAEYIQSMNTPKDVLLAHHDIAHSIIAYRDSLKGEGHTVVPLFHKTEESVEINNVDLIRDELNAVLWMNPFRDKPIPLMLLNEQDSQKLIEDFKSYGDRYNNMADRIITRITAIDRQNFESFVSTYQDVVYGLVETTNTQAIKDQYGDDKEKKSLLKKEYAVLVEQLKGSPDPELIAILRQIYDNQDDPKVLYKEFIKICSPLIEKLRQRTTG